MPYQYDFPCQSASECGQGTCSINADNVTEFFCTCDQSYRSVGDDVCSLDLQNDQTAILLSTLLGFSGADWFYLSKGDTLYVCVGLLKLGLVIFNILVFPMGYFVQEPETLGGEEVVDRYIIIKLGFWLTTLLIGFVWWLTDWIRIIAGSFTSSDGNPLVTC
jgi:hypothetical protein